MIGEGSEGVSVVLDSGGVCGHGWGEGGFQTRPYGSRGGRRGVFRGVTMCVLQGAGESPSPPLPEGSGGRGDLPSAGGGRGGRGSHPHPNPLPVGRGGRGDRPCRWREGEERDRPCRWREGEEGIALAGGGRGGRGSPPQDPLRRAQGRLVGTPQDDNCSLRPCRGTPAQVPVSGYGAGSSSRAPQDDDWSPGLAWAALPDLVE